MGKLISKADIFKRGKIKIDSVYVQDWEGDVRFRAMTMVERREVRKLSTSQVMDKATGDTETQIDNEKFEIYALIYCTLAPDDTDGTKLMFDPDDFRVLENDLAAGPLSVVAQAILKASGLAGADAVKSGEEGDQAGS